MTVFRGLLNIEGIKTFRLSVVLAVVFFFWKSTYRDTPVTSVRHRTYSKRTLVFDSFSRKWEISSVFFSKIPLLLCPEVPSPSAYQLF